MDILLHTIALEPARWIAQKVARPFAELLPAIAQAGFRKLEVFEPHLALGDEAALSCLFGRLHLEPVILSSYLNVNPSVTSDDAFEKGAQELVARVQRFGFAKIRLFPGPGVNPSDDLAVAVVTKRIGIVAQRLPGVEVLLETHDGSIADSPERLAQLVQDLALPNVGLLYQPTVFEREPALHQLELQRPWIRHLHLQNRAIGESGRVVRLSEGAVPWKAIVAEFGANKSQVAASLEFIPSAICPLEEFDFELSLAEAVAETEYARAL